MLGGLLRPIVCSRNDAVVVENLRALAEERVVITDADMLEHADRNDAVECVRSTSR